MAKIEKGRPLPSHTKLKYDECHAKILLEKFFPEVYNDLQISDRPDLRDVVNSVGVEVTSAIPQGEQEALAIACTIPYLSKKERERKITYLKAKGYDYSYIYLLALNGLFRFDIISREWCVRGTQADMFGLSWMARQMVEDGETDDKTQ